MAVNLANIQGDLFSRGFPKIHETYYFFSVVPGQERAFCKALGQLGSSGKVPSLKTVLDLWVQVDREKPKINPTCCFVIGFSKNGLDRIQIGLGGNSLGLDAIKNSDPAFSRGMAADKNNLNDPGADSWDPLFRPSSGSPIHGVLKIGGPDLRLVDQCLNSIKHDLGFPTIIADINALSEPMTVGSRVDGQVRPKISDLNGREHFGFEDSISQPLVEGIDSATALAANFSLKTAQNVILVVEQAPPVQEQSTLNPRPQPSRRPSWMVDGSFLVFRKLEQDVDAFNKFIASNYKNGFCNSAEELAAKMMGRWKNGAPTMSCTETQMNAASPPAPPFSNDFHFGDKNLCPMAAHICKTNPRDGQPDTSRARILRNGIPYGTEFSEHPADKRGLLFACYQSSIDNGYQFIQNNWANNAKFPSGSTGVDPFSAQVAPGEKLYMTLVDSENNKRQLNLTQFVKMKGGEYFFVPSIKALISTLGSV